MKRKISINKYRIIFALTATLLFLCTPAFAATEVVKIVDPDNGTGTDYTSLNAWEAGEQKDLVAADEIAVAKCRSTGGSADTTATIVDGWTTDETHYIKIWTDPTESYRHAGVYPSGNKYRIEVTDAIALQIYEDYAKIFGLAIKVTLSSIDSNTQCIKANNQVLSNKIEIAYNILKGVEGGGTGVLNGIKSSSSNANLHIWNNVIYDMASYGMYLYYGVAHYAYNNTIIDCEYGIRANSNCVATNNLVKGGYDCYYGTFSAGTDYNATDSSDDIGTGLNNRINQIFTFVDETNDDFHLASNDTGAKDYGTDLSSDANLAFSDDIDGNTRSSTWDIGADEHVEVENEVLKGWNGDPWNGDGNQWDL